MGGGILAEVCAQYFFYKVYFMYFMYFMYLLYIRRIGPVTGIVPTTRRRLRPRDILSMWVHGNGPGFVSSPQREEVAFSLPPAPWRMYPSAHGLTLVALQYSFINDVCARLYVVVFFLARTWSMHRFLTAALWAVWKLFISTARDTARSVLSFYQTKTEKRRRMKCWYESIRCLVQ